MDNICFKLIVFAECLLLFVILLNAAIHLYRKHNLSTPGGTLYKEVLEHIYRTRDIPKFDNDNETIKWFKDKISKEIIGECCKDKLKQYGANNLIYTIDCDSKSYRGWINLVKSSINSIFKREEIQKEIFDIIKLNNSM